MVPACDGEDREVPPKIATGGSLSLETDPTSYLAKSGFPHSHMLRGVGSNERSHTEHSSRFTFDKGAGIRTPD